MNLLRTLFRPGRVTAALLLLATFAAGEVADAHHHLSDHGCTAEAGERDDNCTCGGLHAVSLASAAPAHEVPEEHEREFVPVAAESRRQARPATLAVPRAPPRG